MVHKFCLYLCVVSEGVPWLAFPCRYFLKYRFPQLELHTPFQDSCEQVWHVDLWLYWYSLRSAVLPHKVQLDSGSSAKSQLTAIFSDRFMKASGRFQFYMVKFMLGPCSEVFQARHKQGYVDFVCLSVFLSLGTSVQLRTSAQPSQDISPGRQHSPGQNFGQASK